ncbi:hypothetical protein A3C98_02995 [Candidatus Roizmanbacteria bacterium RIFCSPHIGHO2_02_FULL_37_15]|uniref:Uncharacterized protein n=1 Tax=Candidatus Roizmanbacteria bacterium RIFCSPLOWO2_01_FULL_37_16 TaxID=1802058 RepID=A0A1F7IIA5_9BACT|nr:MAG: hypothetical protein A2859_02415 [Candidatus Roizmanbacteria bacterium RIFCSPHIGHO2_01_FULL_37_16b]OGK22695.1 MAG: hypothetical protein A3C98_02995 [Candidatus Roizmanbacteria bacterium RIFCSPHIGHO2_02_FULL_37_15]OGK32617.1 MAG: hypothetical protein A3F57_03395 [Candidatus Roizmanbacteria bacterium RIFCSPHIGHO2_12_FULL_36_11]OGK43090.1 MAG: hypothetical protein A3B40_02410 [Candidatus Roizmanbacteria bacterium RIFCSPLOWO2_01_FULL_37_16]OGK55853.1 MAG: hypothetical protein A3I50_03045 [C
MNEGRELFEVYCPELRATFDSFVKEAKEFTQRNQGKIATLYTTPDIMRFYADELVALAGSLEI